MSQESVPTTVVNDQQRLASQYPIIRQVMQFQPQQSQQQTLTYNLPTYRICPF